MLAVRDLSPIPDNIYLITDGLPTRAAASPRNPTVDLKDSTEIISRSRYPTASADSSECDSVSTEGDPGQRCMVATGAPLVHLSPLLGIGHDPAARYRRIQRVFSDVICCGFGAVILLQRLTKTLELQVRKQ